MKSMFFLILITPFIFCHSAFSKTIVKDIGDINLFSPEDTKQILSQNFLFTNETPQILKFGPIQKSCGCTVLKLEKETLNPSESTKIVMQIDLSKKIITHDFFLNESGLIKFENEPDALELIIRGKIRMRGIPVSVDLGQLKDENFRVRRFISIFPLPRSNFEVVEVNCSNPKVKTFFKKDWFSSNCEIHFEFNMPEMNYGVNTFELIAVYYLNAKKTTQRTIVKFEKMEKVSHPKSISMGVVNIKSNTVSKTFELSPGYAGVDFQIRSISTNPQGYLLCDCEKMEENRITCVANFKIPPDIQPNKPYKGNIRIELSNNIKPISIPVFLFPSTSD